MSQSNDSQVVIRNVGFGLAGNFSCEVTADAPLFSTGTAYSQMQVIGECVIALSHLFRFGRVNVTSI